jgi:hypothetical protein
VKALVGDRIEVRRAHVGEGRRQGEVVEVRGTDGELPYLVRWSDGHEGLSFPGLDASIDHKRAKPPRPAD